MYGTKTQKKTTGVNKGASGRDLEAKKTVSAEKVETKIEGSKTTDVQQLVENDPESKKAYEELSDKVNEEADFEKEEAAREEIPNSTTEVVDGTGVTKDENTNTNENSVPEQPEVPEVPQLTSEDGTKEVVDPEKIHDVPSQETQEEKKEEKKEEKTPSGIQEMVFDDEEPVDSKESSKPAIDDDKKASEEKTDKKAEEKSSKVEEKVEEVLPAVEETIISPAVLEETKEETKEAPKAELVDTKKEVKPVTEDKTPVAPNATFAETVVAVDRSGVATFVVTSGKVVSASSADEQISVSNNGNSIVVTNNFPEFDGTISFTAVDELGQATTLTVIFK